MAEPQVIYLFDRAKHNLLMYPALLEDGQAMPDNATDVVCPNGLFEPCFDETGKKWVGISQEEWEAKYPQQTAQPAADAQAMNALGLQVAQLTVGSNQLKQSINQLGLQVAKAIATNSKENGGN